MIERPIDDFRTAARLLGWEEVPSRRGDGPVATLVPTESDAARPRSLSAAYGLGAFPLHTDGAHHPVPPDLVVLGIEAPSDTPTFLYRPRRARTTRAFSYGLRHGIFRVNTGANSFFTTATIGRGVRFDPGCMIACDERARFVATYFAEAIHDADRHPWTKSGTLLLIDNWSTLHGRAEIAEGDESRTLQRVAFRTKDQL